MNHNLPLEKPEHASSVTFREAFMAFGKIGLLSFGGPAGQIALMHRVIVDEKGWLSEDKFLNALSFCMLLPGPEAMQLATYAGWRLKGVKGGLLAGLLFVLPGAAIVLALSILYALLGDLPLVNAIFLGVKAAVVIIVIEALLKVAKRALKRVDYYVVAAFAFFGIFFLTLPFPLIVALAALYGGVTSQKPTRDQQKIIAGVPFMQTVKTIALWLAIWWLPIALLFLVAPETILVPIGFFFSKLAVVTFGGAYAVLAYMSQDVVGAFQWLKIGEMMDGLGLAETTPGPLILVTEFVGFLAAYRQGGLWLGLTGALLTLWVTFAPCFLWIFAGAPYVEWIATQPRLKGALAAITAAVVGVILNLTLWFALHVFFLRVETTQWGAFTFLLPDFATLDFRVVALSLLSGVMLLVYHRGIMTTLLVMALLGVGLHAGGL